MVVRRVMFSGENIAEGSIGQSDPERAQFLKIANRSVIETVACFHLIHRRRYLEIPQPLRSAYQESHKLSAKIQAMRKSISSAPIVREDPADYELSEYCPFWVVNPCESSRRWSVVGGLSRSAYWKQT